MVEAAEWERGAAEVRERKAQPESPNGKNAAEAIKREERGRSRQEIKTRPKPPKKKNAAEATGKEKRGRSRRKRKTRPKPRKRIMRPDGPNQRGDRGDRLREDDATKPPEYSEIH
ncbi:hypothetical protein [Paraburkholderia kururiensis]|uniref:hypothetical protein n=1 Tax=Paraburkholderia kururiensis TaxID=984307 RepID=UPI0039A5FB51